MTRTTVSPGDEDIQVEVELEHACPKTGTAVITLTERQTSYYCGSLKEYTYPEICPSDTYEAKVYANWEQATIQQGNNNVSVKLLDGVSQSGVATVRIVSISDEIEGRVEGDVRPLSDYDNESSGVDMTNLSKL